MGVRRKGRTIGLDSDIHLGLRGVRDGVGAELDIGTIRNVNDGSGERGLVMREVPATAYICQNGTHFFIMTYLRALPRVWPSLRNSKDAAVGVEPGSCLLCQSLSCPDGAACDE